VPGHARPLAVLIPVEPVTRTAAARCRCCTADAPHWSGGPSPPSESVSSSCHLPRESRAVPRRCHVLEMPPQASYSGWAALVRRTEPAFRTGIFFMSPPRGRDGVGQRVRWRCHVGATGELPPQVPYNGWAALVRRTEPAFRTCIFFITPPRWLRSVHPGRHVKPDDVNRPRIPPNPVDDIGQSHGSARPPRRRTIGTGH
jgi:hypothetical protein